MQTSPSRQHGPTPLHAPEKPAGHPGGSGSFTHTPFPAQRVLVGQQLSPHVRPLAQTAYAGGMPWHWPFTQALPLGQHSLPHAVEPDSHCTGCGVPGQLMPAPQSLTEQHESPVGPQAVWPGGQHRGWPVVRPQTIPPGQQRLALH